LSFSLRARRTTWPVVLLFLSLLAGCGGSDGTVTPTVNPLTNPDKVLFASGRTSDSIWRFFAMNPDGSSVTLVPTLNKIGAKDILEIAVNQNGTHVVLEKQGFIGSVRSLVRLSDGVTLYSTSLSSAQTVLAANSTGTQIAVAGQPAVGDPYAIFLLATDGTSKNRIAAVPAGSVVSEITFSLDDQTLYYVTVPVGSSTQALGNGLLTKLVAGGTPIVVANIGASIRSVHTSRDGTKLAFLSEAQAADGSVHTFTPYTLHADGTGLQKGAVTTLTEDMTPLNISIAGRADGFHILYASTVEGAEELFDMRPDGSDLRQITFNAAGNGVPASRAVTADIIRMLGGR
jgi:Tol biopolymer transport system component